MSLGRRGVLLAFAGGGTLQLSAHRKVHTGEHGLGARASRPSVLASDQRHESL